MAADLFILQPTYCENGRKENGNATPYFPVVDCYTGNYNSMKEKEICFQKNFYGVFLAFVPSSR
jgi:hypothetical protein